MDWMDSRILCGCVDWNWFNGTEWLVRYVASYVGAWIETIRACAACAALWVASYVGAWIET